MNSLKNDLQKLYGDYSKHSVYQNVPDFVSSELEYAETIDENWRSDRPRLAYLLANRQPAVGEVWLDFGANTGFFTLSLAHQFPKTKFIAVEANANHADFINRIADFFSLKNVEIIKKSIGYMELQSLPKVDFMLHLNVLHHAGHDFDSDILPCKELFPEYAIRYLHALRERTSGMLFQIGSNWGGNKTTPLVAVQQDAKKLFLFHKWLNNAGWIKNIISYPHKNTNGKAVYMNFEKIDQLLKMSENDIEQLKWDWLDDFPGEFYRRPLFHCYE